MQEEASFKVAQIIVLRRQNRSEDQIAKELEFKPKPNLTATQVMYQWLADFGLPEWIIYPWGSYEPNRAAGVKALDSEGKDERAEKPKDKGERVARSVGDAVDLPPASRAAELFHWQIRRWSGTPPAGVNVLLETLEEHIDALDELGERLHGERFVSASRVEHDWENYDRTTFSEEEWKEFCEKHGVDPARGEFALLLDPYVVPLNARTSPSWGLTQLIAMYALSNQWLDPLLDALHYDPSKADRMGLRKDVDQLRHYAERIAKRVRGGTVRRGHPDPEISQYELLAKWSCIDPLREKGHSDQEILDELKARRFHREGGEDFSLEDVRRLGGLKLPPPF